LNRLAIKLAWYMAGELGLGGLGGDGSL